MQFCKDCGGVLNLFGKNSTGLCSSCIQHKKEPEVTRAKATPDFYDLLSEAIVTVENGKIILHSKEGWQLWSAPSGSKTTLQSILKAAELIYNIRNKRRKSK
jgi:hypothetical protein